MAELVHHRMLELVDREGNAYDRVFVYAEPQRGGTWAGWLEFASPDGRILQTDRETTQSALEGVAYWATGLQPTYFEGALDRALRRTVEPRSGHLPGPLQGGGAVSLRLVTVDPDVPFRLMVTRTLVPGMRRHIHNGGTILYRGRVNPSAGKDEPGIYEFVAQFGSENAAGILANRLWSDLHGLAATLEIDGVPVPIRNSAIKEALLAAQSVP